MRASQSRRSEEASPSLLRHLAGRWPLYLAFAISLLLADPVARGVAVCVAHGAPGCPAEVVHG